MATYQFIDVKQAGAVFCARLNPLRFDEAMIQKLGAELTSLIDKEGCRKLVLNFGSVNCHYSVMIAMLIRTHRKIQNLGGAMKLCDITPETMGVFEACQLKNYFQFEADEAAALAAFGQQ